MAEAPLVDVGVVTWNTRELTVAALRRLVDSDQGVDLRLLVHDNASGDGTPAAIRAEIPQAEVTVSDTNLGFAAGVNRLLSRSNAPWFLCLNSDAWPEPGAIGELVRCAERHPKAAVVAPRLVRPDGTLELSTHPFPAGLTALAAAVGLRGRWARRNLLPGAWEHDEERQVDWAVGAALLLRRTAVDELGGFDESFFMYVEDLEWAYRASRCGWQVWFDPSAVVIHVGNASGAKKWGLSREAVWIANTYSFYGRHHGNVATSVLRVANATGALRRAGIGLRRSDRDMARFWWRQARLHLRGHTCGS